MAPSGTRSDRAEAEIRASITHALDAIDDMDGRLERLDHAVRGNGDYGLVTRVALLDKRVDDFERFVDEVKGLRRWMALGAISFASSLIWRAVEWILIRSNA